MTVHHMTLKMLSVLATVRTFGTRIPRLSVALEPQMTKKVCPVFKLLITGWTLVRGWKKVGGDKKIDAIKIQ